MAKEREALPDIAKIEAAIEAKGYVIQNGLICKRLPDGRVVPDWSASITLTEDDLR